MRVQTASISLRVRPSWSAARPIRCERAQQDIAALESHRISGTRRAVTGVTSVTPAGAASGVATGQTGDRASAVSGDFNRQIDDRIALIRRTCGL